MASGEVRGGAPGHPRVRPARPGPHGGPHRRPGADRRLGVRPGRGRRRRCATARSGAWASRPPAGPVPIVVALGLFDLTVGDPAVRPGADEGYAACVAATAGPVEAGPGGRRHRRDGRRSLAGVPSTPAPRRPGHRRRPGRRPGGGGPGGGERRRRARRGRRLGGRRLARAACEPAPRSARARRGFANTTIGVVATNARLDKVGCHLVAQGAHDGLARAVFPAHTRVDGDAFVAAAAGGVRGRRRRRARPGGPRASPGPSAAWQGSPPGRIGSLGRALDDRAAP